MSLCCTGRRGVLSPSEPLADDASAAADPDRGGEFVVGTGQSKQTDNQLPRGGPR